MERLVHTHSDDRSELLSAYSDNAVDVVERRRVEEYIRGCPACAQELRELRMFRELLGDLPKLQPPRSFTIDPRQAPRPRWLLFPTLRLASALAALLLFVVLGVDGLSSVDSGAGAPSAAMSRRRMEQVPAAQSQAESAARGGEGTGAGPEAAFAPMPSAASSEAAAAALEAAPAQGDPAAGVTQDTGGATGAAAGAASGASTGAAAAAPPPQGGDSPGGVTAMGDAGNASPAAGEPAGVDTVTLDDEGFAAADNATPSPFDMLLIVELALGLAAVAFGIGAFVAWRRGI